jgi:hypothetical protein
MMEYSPIDPGALYDASLGWPLCECGHSRSMHDPECGCRRVECMGWQAMPRCRFYRPASRIPDSSPARFAEMVGVAVRHHLPSPADCTNRDEITNLVQTVVAQLAVQWSGWGCDVVGYAAAVVCHEAMAHPVHQRCNPSSCVLCALAVAVRNTSPPATK